jgi:hypothetical protein
MNITRANDEVSMLHVGLIQIDIQFFKHISTNISNIMISQILVLEFREPLINSEVPAAQGSAAKINGYNPLIL